MKTLCRPSDVIQYSPVKLTFNPCEFRELYNIEQEQRRKCLGGLYNDMVAALADYSTAVNYVSGTTYNEGDVVAFTTNLQRLYYVALVTTTALPTVATDWELAPRFTGNCAETFEGVFCDYIGPYLAHTVVGNRMPYIYTKLTDVGVTQYQDANHAWADDKQYTRLQNAVFRDRDTVWKNFEEWMGEDAQKENDCLKNWKGYETKCGCKCGGVGCKNCRAGKLKVGRYDVG